MGLADRRPQTAPDGVVEPPLIGTSFRAVALTLKAPAASGAPIVLDSAALIIVDSAASIIVDSAASIVDVAAFENDAVLTKVGVEKAGVEETRLMKSVSEPAFSGGERSKDAE